MVETAQLAERLPPRKKSAARDEPKALCWSTQGVPRLYLDDIEDIFQVMKEYAPHSPWSKSSQRLYEVDHEIYKGEVDFYERLGDKDRLAALKPPDPPQPLVEIETDDFEGIYSIEDLSGLREKGSRTLTMRVGRGYGDLRLRCSSYDCAIRTMDDDVHAARAFDQIKELASRRSIKLIELVQSMRFVASNTFLFIAVLVFNQFSDLVVFDWLYLFLAAGGWMLAIWSAVIWARRKNVVVLKYRREAPTFREENGRDIIKWVIIGVLGGILLLMATRAINEIWPEDEPQQQSKSSLLWAESILADAQFGPQVWWMYPK